MLAGVSHETRTIPAADGVPLHVEIWRPEGPARFVVPIVHGSGEHVGRHAWLGEAVAARGGLAFGPDHRGEGLSGGPRGHTDAFETYARDLAAVAAAVRDGEDAWTDETPVLPFGHSMGGLILLVALIDGVLQPAPAGAVISAPLLGLALRVPWLKAAAARLAAKIVPTLSQPADIPPSAISRDPDVVRAYEADDRRSRVITVGWFAAMERAIARVEGSVAALDLPMLWLVGTGDRIVDPAAVRRVFERLPDPSAHDQRLEVFEGYYHELHNEPPDLREPVRTLVLDWLVDHAGPPGA